MIPSRQLVNSTHLLVSIRRADEVDAAITGGADLIDIKEPSAGPLGLPDRPTLEAIAERLRNHSPKLNEVKFGSGIRLAPVSLAIGEFRELIGPRTEPIAVPSPVGILKVGFAGSNHPGDWVSDLEGLVKRTEHHNARRFAWVPVHYADAERVDAPPFAEVVAAAIRLRDQFGGHVPGVLIDTAIKTGPRLTECLSIDRLRECREFLVRSNLFSAFAGRMRRTDIPLLRSIKPDLLGFRSAVCERSNREATCRADRVRALRKLLDESNASRSDLEDQATPGEMRHAVG